MKIIINGRPYYAVEFKEPKRDPQPDNMLPFSCGGFTGQIENIPRSDGRTYGITDGGVGFSLVICTTDRILK